MYKIDAVEVEGLKWVERGRGHLQSSRKRETVLTPQYALALFEVTEGVGSRSNSQKFKSSSREGTAAWYSTTQKGPLRLGVYIVL